MDRKIFLWAAIFGIMSLCYKVEAKTTGADFLKLGAGARSSGMGEAFTAVADNAETIFFNPAGLGYLTSREITAMWGDKREDTSRMLFFYAQPLESDEGDGVIGAGVIYEDMGTNITNTGRDINTGAYFNEGEVHPYEMAVMLSYGKLCKNNISFGSNLKYIHRDLKENKADGFAVDAGVLYKTRIKGMTVGADIENLGTKIKFIDQEDELPLNLRLGGAYNLIVNENNSLLLAVDLNQHLYDDILSPHIGVEYSLLKTFYGRLGWFDKSNELDGFTYGVGVRCGGYSIDLANVPGGDMEDTENILRLSFSVVF